MDQLNLRQYCGTLRVLVSLSEMITLKGWDFHARIRGYEFLLWVEISKKSMDLSMNVKSRIEQAKFTDSKLTGWKRSLER